MECNVSRPSTDTSPLAGGSPILPGDLSLEGSWRITLTEGGSRGVGLLLIRQTGRRITASQGIFPALPLMPDQIELNALVTGSDVTGVWSGLDGESGSFVWTLTPDGHAFAGCWRRRGADGWAGEWTGVRA